MDNGSLIIEEVQATDTGVKYVCKVENEFGKDTASAFLDVKALTKTLKGPKDIPLQEGKSAIFDCLFEVGFENSVTK